MMLQDKVVVVAGVGPGLGRSIALASAREGADMVLAARTATRLDDVAKEVAGLGRRGLVVPTDLADSAAADHLAEAALDGFGRVDALVYNALAMPPIKALGDASLEALDASFDANVVAALRLTRLFTPALAPRHCTGCWRPTRRIRAWRCGWPRCRNPARHGKPGRPTRSSSTSRPPASGTTPGTPSSPPCTMWPPTRWRSAGSYCGSRCGPSRGSA